MGSDLVSNDAVLHVFLIRQAEMFFRRDVAEHRCAVPANHRRADRRSDVIVAGGDVGRQRAKRVERRFAAPFELLLDVLFDEVHWDMPGTFVHHLAVVFPGDLRQLTLRFEFGELRFIIRVGDRAGTQTITKRERNVVGRHDFADVSEARVEKTFFMMREAPLGHD